eukprot:6201423-Pleurochrysis_carterae.AAC.4
MAADSHVCAPSECRAKMDGGMGGHSSPQSSVAESEKGHGEAMLQEALQQHGWPVIIIGNGAHPYASVLGRAEWGQGVDECGNPRSRMGSGVERSKGEI